MPTRTASATWRGALKSGTGAYQGQTGLTGSYTFGSRFEESPGSNPEELLAAAQAACFSMALSGALEKGGATPETIQTTARCTVEKTGDRFSITTIQLDVQATASGLDDATFQKIAEATKDGCPVSRALANNVKIELNARLVES